MRYDKLEAVMRAGWAVVQSKEGAPGFDNWLHTQALESALEAADPHGVYKPDAPSAGMDCQNDFMRLRESPRMPRDPEDL
jgi:hypothetical protein